MSSLIIGRLDEGSPDRALAAVTRGTEPLAEVIAFPGKRSAPSPSLRAPTTGNVFQLKFTLLDTKPPIWRRVLVDGGGTLDHLHEVIQAAFGWWNTHLHEFEVGRTRYGVPDPHEDWGEPPRDERRTRLDAIAGEGSAFWYTYDFGDGWDHKITVEKVLAADSAPAAPACIGGRRNCPPEDCGGTWATASCSESSPTRPIPSTTSDVSGSAGRSIPRRSTRASSRTTFATAGSTRSTPRRNSGPPNRGLSSHHFAGDPGTTS